MVKRLRPEEIPDPDDSYRLWVGLSPEYKRATREAERSRAEQAREREAREAAERARVEQAGREQEEREAAERVRLDQERREREDRERRERQEQDRREREVREAAERIRREQEEGIRKREREERERERRRQGTIDSWNRGLISYRESTDAAAARFVFNKLGLDLYDDNVGEKFLNIFWGDAFFKSQAGIDEKGGFFLQTITGNFDGYQLKRYKRILDHMAKLFEGSTRDVKAGIQNRIDNTSPLEWAIARTKDDNITQGVKEFFCRSRRE